MLICSSVDVSLNDWVNLIYELGNSLPSYTRYCQRSLSFGLNTCKHEIIMSYTVFVIEYR